MMKVIPYTIHEIKGGQVLTKLVEPETMSNFQDQAVQPAAVSSETDNNEKAPGN